MRKAFAIAVVLLLWTSSLAAADSFRVVYKSAGGETFAAYSPIIVRGADGGVLFKGRTDGHGRIRVDLRRRGSHQVDVVYRQKTYRLKLTLDGSKDLKKVVLSEAQRVDP